jgi:hypothetical protein
MYDLRSGLENYFNKTYDICEKIAGPVVLSFLLISTGLVLSDPQLNPLLVDRGNMNNLELTSTHSITNKERR